MTQQKQMNVSCALSSFARDTVPLRFSLQITYVLTPAANINRLYVSGGYRANISSFHDLEKEKYLNNFCFNILLSLFPHTIILIPSLTHIVIPAPTNLTSYQYYIFTPQFCTLNNKFVLNTIISFESNAGHVHPYSYKTKLRNILYE